MWSAAGATLGLAFVAMLCVGVQSSAGADKLPAGHVLLSQTASERATAGIGNKIVSFGGRTHVVWQDSTPRGYFARVRTLDRASGEWSATVTLGKGVDNHARPCITVDSRGHLHVIIGGHNSPLQYLRSVRANDSSEWTKPFVFGKGTYPSLVCGAADTLVLAVRPGGWAGVKLWIKPADGRWAPRSLVLEKEPQYSGYSGYNVALAWGPKGKRLHFAADVYEGHGTYKRRGTNQAIVYMYSDDLGRTWKRSDGSAIEGRPFPKNMDTIALNNRQREQDMPRPVLRIAGMVVDSRGRPFVLYTQHEPDPGRAHLATPDGKGEWTQLPLHEALAKHCPGYGALGARGAFAITADDVMQMLLPIAPLADFGVPGAPKIVPARVRHRWIETRDGGATFLFRQPIPDDPTVSNQVPTLERPTGQNVILPGRAAGLMYFVGLQRYRKKGELIQNRLYYVDVAAAK